MVIHTDVINNLENGKITRLQMADWRTTTGTHLDIHDLQRLRYGIQESSTLRELDLSSNRLGDSAVETLADALKANRSIRKLKLSNNLITDDGMELLGKALAGHPTLECIDVSRNLISATGINALLPIVSAPQLTELVVHEGFLSSAKREDYDKGMQLLAQEAAEQANLNINRISPPASVMPLELQAVIRRNVEAGDVLRKEIINTPTASWSVELINRAAARHGILSHLMDPHDTLQELDEILDTMPYFKHWDEVNPTRVTTPDPDTGFTPMDNPKFWPHIDYAFGRLERHGEDPFTKADFMQPNRDGTPSLITGIIHRQTETVLKHLNNQCEYLTPDDLLDEHGQPNALLQAAIEHRELPKIFVQSNWEDQGKQALATVVAALPEDAKSTIHNLHALSIAVERRNFAANSLQIG